MKQFGKALTKLNYIFDTIPKKYAAQLWLIRGVVHQLLGNGQFAKSDFKRANKYDKENAKKFLEDK